MDRADRRTLVIFSALSLIGVPSFAQTFEAVGARAQGMGGAFVAVADDATAVYWNPAGLATGATFDVQVGIGGGEGAGSRAFRISSGLVAVALPALGMTYYRLRMTSAARVSPTVLIAGGRQEGGLGEVRLESVTTHNVGITLVQSIVNKVVAGTTLRLVSGQAAAGLVSAEDLEAALNAAQRLTGTSRMTFDLDAGMMVSLGNVRLGMVGRNLREPAFGLPAGPAEAVFERHFRVGVAVLGPVVASADFDLTRSAGPSGDYRNIAAGVERWSTDGRLGIRAGFRANTVEGARAVATAGLSYAVRNSILIEGQVTKGGSRADQGWALTARLTF